MKQMDKMGVHGSIEKFERLFEDMDVKTEELNGALDSVYNSAVDQSEVNALIEEVKDESGMEVADGIKGAKKEGLSYEKKGEVDDMQKRLDQLKNL